MSVNMTPSAHCDFFSRFTAPLFAFYRETRGATPVWYATPYIYVYPSRIPSPPSCCHRNLCHERRERERERDVIKKNSRKFSKKTCPVKGDIRLPRKNPQYSRVMTDNYLEGFGTKEGSWQGRGGLEGGGKHVSLVNDNDEHWCKPDDNA